jgi:chemotaxis signal transduction protein
MKFTNLQYMVTGAGVENLEESSNKNTTNLTKVVVFSFGGRKYALEILELQEIIKIPKIAPLPGTSEYIAVSPVYEARWLLC